MPVIPTLPALDARRVRGPLDPPRPPGILYVMSLLLLCAVPLGVVAAFSRPVAHAVTVAMTSYLRALPEPLYAALRHVLPRLHRREAMGKTPGVDR